ncbi:MAG: flagellar FliJ family protein [Pirellulales bacterium]|nr:flagellar FliJ family protein [Pirellulales bacterium]
MARRADKLETLRKVREAARNQRRLTLAEAQQAEMILEKQRAELEQNETNLLQNRRRAASPNTFDLNQLINAQRHQMALEAEKSMLHEQSQILTDEVRRRRAALVHADQEVRAVEKLQNKLDAARQCQQAHHENRELEEAALQKYMRLRRGFDPCT